MAWAPRASAREGAGAADVSSDLLATLLFASAIASEPGLEDAPLGFLAAPSLPPLWQPGTALQLRGPLGRGFSPPGNLRRLAAAALGESAERLLALLYPALAREIAAALFSDAPPPGLPSALEVRPLSELPEALAWADFLALDLPLEALPRLRQSLGLEPSANSLPCTAQVLVTAAMPCGGLADCGACALETRRGWKLACKDGPVFDVSELLAKL
jgi:dihydroorotate dehydrogenase electron transfer subunit